MSTTPDQTSSTQLAITTIDQSPESHVARLHRAVIGPVGTDYYLPVLARPDMRYHAIPTPTNTGPDPRARSIGPADTFSAMIMEKPATPPRTSSGAESTKPTSATINRKRNRLLPCRW